MTDGHRAKPLEVPLVFTFETSEESGHSNREYAYACKVLALEEVIFIRWGRTADEAERNARWQVKVNVAKLLSRPA